MRQQGYLWVAKTASVGAAVNHCYLYWLGPIWSWFIKSLIGFTVFSSQVLATLRYFAIRISKKTWFFAGLICHRCSCDVHHGNGTLSTDPNIVTISGVLNREKPLPWSRKVFRMKMKTNAWPVIVGCLFKDLLVVANLKYYLNLQCGYFWCWLWGSLW